MSGAEPSPAAEATGAVGCWGTVLAVQANYYSVKTDPVDGQPSALLLCTRRARLKKVGQQVMVGDRVRVDDPDWAGGRGAIAQVAPRRTLLDRPPVANADQVLLVFALAEPALDPTQLTRFLIKAESTGLRVSLCLNKHDLLTAAQRQSWVQRLQDWGYAPSVISVEQEQSWPALMQQLQGHISVVSGPSGVGKSSLINRLIPAAALRTGAVSGKLGRGRHTTRHVELFELPLGGFLADTPGFNQPDLDCTAKALAACFPEIRRQLEQATCQFSDCLHQDEPGCAVSSDWDRYPLYLTLLAEALARQDSLSQQREPEAAFKLKAASDGGTQHEPMLLAKKYRRVSRRSNKQSLQHLYDETVHGDGGAELED